MCIGSCALALKKRQAEEALPETPMVWGNLDRTFDCITPNVRSQERLADDHTSEADSDSTTAEGIVAERDCSSNSPQEIREGPSSSSYDEGAPHRSTQQMRQDASVSEGDISNQIDHLLRDITGLIEACDGLDGDYDLEIIKECVALCDDGQGSWTDEVTSLVKVRAILKIAEDQNVNSLSQVRDALIQQRSSPPALREIQQITHSADDSPVDRAAMNDTRNAIRKAISKEIGADEVDDMIGSLDGRLSTNFSLTRTQLDLLKQAITLCNSTDFHFILEQYSTHPPI